MSFKNFNKAFNNVFVKNKLTLGLAIPIENYESTLAPTMEHHAEMAILAEDLGFKAIWLRDVPFNVPNFGDAGQMFDPFTYLGYLAAKTSTIALGTSSIILPLRHPVHTFKSAATIDHLSDGRLIMGIASGDRYEDYPGMNVKFNIRAELFREAFTYFKEAYNNFPTIKTSHLGCVNNIDILPKPNNEIPLLITGGSAQSMAWGAEHSDGFITYPRSIVNQAAIIQEWRNLIPENQPDKPISQSLYIDIMDDDNAPATPIHLGFALGINTLLNYLFSIEEIGVNHVMLNLRFNRKNIRSTLELIATKILPYFN